MYRIYYADGSFVDDLPPEQVSTVGVQVIIQDRHTWKGYDFYVRRGDRWWGCDLGGLMLYFTYPGTKHVLLGSWIPNEEFTAIDRAAEEYRAGTMT